MPSLATLTIIGLVVLGVLIWLFFRTRTGDLITEMVEKRRPNSRLVCRADYVEGRDHIPVALALTDDTFYYENPDLQASFELRRIEEVDYDDELLTGHAADPAHRVLRLRSHGRAFEYLLARADADKWAAALPARHLDDQARAV